MVLRPVPVPSSVIVTGWGEEGTRLKARLRREGRWASSMDSVEKALLSVIWCRKCRGILEGRTYGECCRLYRRLWPSGRRGLWLGERGLDWMSL